MTATPGEILDFWLGPRGDVAPGEEATARWFRSDPELDRVLRRRFGDRVEAALEGELDAWADGEPAARVALILLLDQFPRNLFRGDPRAFAGDEAASALSAGISAEPLEALHPVERYFVYVPFMHAESLDLQQRGVDAFGREAEFGPSAFRNFFANGRDFAERHRLVIERFGRFPHRNAILERETTAEEERFLAEHPAGF